MNLITIDELDIRDKRVLIRVDFNILPDKNGQLKEGRILMSALPTIEYALKEKARVIIASHAGRPGGRPSPNLSLEPVGKKLSEMLDRAVFFPEDCIGDGAKKLAADLPPGGIMLLENLRFHKGEDENDTRFAKRLAELADIYVNEAFSISHRIHASTVAIPDFVGKAAVGLGFKREMENLRRLVENPARPFAAVIGGRSTSEKLPIIESLLARADSVLIGGAVSNTFLKALGKKLGKSVTDPTALYRASKLISAASARNVRLSLPEDAVIIKGDLSNDPPSFIMSLDVVPDDAAVVDIGPKTIESYAGRIHRAKTIFWNGPVGIYERGAFKKGTLAMAEAIADSSAFSFVAGWDTTLALEEGGYSDKISYISTGGRASIEFIQGNRLPALEALAKKLL